MLAPEYYFFINNIFSFALFSLNSHIDDFKGFASLLNNFRNAKGKPSGR